jgi:hypothetical protein
VDERVAKPQVKQFFAGGFKLSVDGVRHADKISLLTMNPEIGRTVFSYRKVKKFRSKKRLLLTE